MPAFIFFIDSIGFIPDICCCGKGLSYFFDNWRLNDVVSTANDDDLRRFTIQIKVQINTTTATDTPTASPTIFNGGFDSVFDAAAIPSTLLPATAASAVV